MNDLFREARIKKGMTLQELAAELGVFHQQVSNWEHGRHLPPKRVIKKLCQVLDLPQEETLLKYVREFHKDLF